MFKVVSENKPAGDQPQAIEKIVTAYQDERRKHQVMLGVTGSGKTFTMAHIIEKLQLPTLIIAPNKTLAAQLFYEFKDLFPQNAVEFFISYYDYYQPEAYVPSSDTYIAKDASINDDIEKMRHAATRSLFERKDVIIIASVSCIYGLGSPETYAKLICPIQTGMKISRRDFLRKLVEIQYTRNDKELKRGSFRVRGETIDVLASHQKAEAVRVEFFGDEIESIHFIDVLTGKTLSTLQELTFYPNSHYVTDHRDRSTIVKEILYDLGVRLREFKALGKFIEYQRLEQRVMHDIEIFEQLGYCPGIENYSRYLSGSKPGDPPPTLLDYFPEQFLTILDESHLTVPQISGMYRGDRARKMTLVEFGFRLPSALDNRPLNFEEFLQRTQKLLHVSATPGHFELDHVAHDCAELVIRPTGLLDPEIEIVPTAQQVADLESRMQEVNKRGGKVLITTLTKRMAEDLTRFYTEHGLRVSYLHSDIDSLERIEIIRALRSDKIDAIIGINLLREGLDIPEVELVAIMDADKEGFLRSKSALIQTVGRAARNVGGKVIFYADQITESMRACMDETQRRREKQFTYNKIHGIIPKTIEKKLGVSLRELYGLVLPQEEIAKAQQDPQKILNKYEIKNSQQLDKTIRKKSKEMDHLARELRFEEAAALRDEVEALRGVALALGNF